MSERPRIRPAAPSVPPWALDTSSGRSDFLRGLDNRFYGGVSSRGSRIGSGAGRFSDRSSRSGSGSFFSGGGDSSPYWYRWLAVGASGLSLIALFLILVMR